MAQPCDRQLPVFLTTYRTQTQLSSGEPVDAEAFGNRGLAKSLSRHLMKNLRQNPRNFDEIFADPHRRCLLPARKVKEICAAVRQRLLDSGFEEAGALSVPEDGIWMRAYGHRKPVTRRNADVILDKGGYRFEGRPVFRITVRNWQNNAALGGEIFALLLEKDIVAPTVVDVFEQNDGEEDEQYTSFTFVFIPTED
jgi:hypothetical protein